jgi:undecaprenyl diphosphate synthase
MGFNRDVIRRRRDELDDLGVRIRWIGRRKKLWKSVQDELDEAVELTRRNRKLTLTMCVNYGGQSEIVDAVQRITQKVESGEIEASSISERNFAKYLYDKNLPAVDLLIRTSGEVRISNFLLWQSAYAELVFDETLWPDYRRENLYQALEIYRKRTRRFGTA